MLLRLAIYWIGFVVIVLLYALGEISECEYKKPVNEKKYRNTMKLLNKIINELCFLCMIVYFFYNIYMLIFSYDTLIRVACLAYIVFFGFLNLESILDDQEWKYFNSVKDFFQGFFIILSLVGLVAYLVMICFFMMSGMNWKGKESDKHEEYAYSIDILEMREVPYTNTYGWYVRSAPSNAYYYEVVNENGNIITEVIDGQEYYVERDEDDKYISNPHIDVYYTIQQCYNIYTMKTFEDVVDKRYVICIPEDSIYYEK